MPTTLSLRCLPPVLQQMSTHLFYSVSISLLFSFPRVCPLPSSDLPSDSRGWQLVRNSFSPIQSQHSLSPEDVLTTHDYLDRVAFLDHLANARDAGVRPTVILRGFRGEVLSPRHSHTSLLDAEVGWGCSWNGAPQVQGFTLVQASGGRFQLRLGKQL